MIHFSENLFLTDSVKPELNRIKFKVFSGIGLVNVCFITFAANTNDVFDIYPASYFKQKNLRKRDFYVLGIAENYGAAVNMISDMIEQCINDKDYDDSVRRYYERIIKW